MFAERALRRGETFGSSPGQVLVVLPAARPPCSRCQLRCGQVWQSLSPGRDLLDRRRTLQLGSFRFGLYRAGGSTTNGDYDVWLVSEEFERQLWQVIRNPVSPE